jgi:hypothetical protein
LLRKERLLPAFPAGAGPRWARRAAGDYPRPGRARQPPLYRILHRQHPQPQPARPTVKQFFDWCDERWLKLADIEAITVAGYIDQLGIHASKPTVKQHLAAIRPTVRLSDHRHSGG